MTSLGHLLMTSTAAPNMGFAIAGLTCFVDTVVLDRTVSLRSNCSANHPRHRKPLKRKVLCWCRCGLGFRRNR